MYDTSSTVMFCWITLFLPAARYAVGCVPYPATTFFTTTHLRVPSRNSLLAIGDHHLGMTQQSDNGAIRSGANLRGRNPTRVPYRIGPVTATLEVEVLRFHNPASGSATDVAIGRIHSDRGGARNGKALPSPVSHGRTEQFCRPLAEAHQKHRADSTDLARGLNNSCLHRGSYNVRTCSLYSVSANSALPQPCGTTKWGGMKQRSFPSRFDDPSDLPVVRLPCPRPCSAIRHGFLGFMQMKWSTDDAPKALSRQPRAAGR